MPEPKTNQVPDTATTYERAKPEAQSPSGKLTAPKAAPDKNADTLKDNAAPSTAKPTKS